MSDKQSRAEPTVAPAAPGKQKSFHDLIREYVIPYNTLLAVAGFLSVLFGYISAVALTTFAVVLFIGILQLIALELVAKKQIVEWSGKNTGIVSAVASALWPDAQSTMLKTSPFWALVVVAIAVIFYTVRTVLG
jgi:hypothetical protein